MTARQREHELLRLTAIGEPDVFAVRQHGREIAKAIGMDGQDQNRVAVVLSDVGRELLRRSNDVGVTFALRLEPRSALVISFEWPDDRSPQAVLAGGWETAARLMDEAKATQDRGRASVTLVKYRPAVAAPLTAHGVADLRWELTSRTVASPLDELRAQNQELLETLENLEAKQSELVRLNDELEETNQGVVALYKELSEELEETNRGVVALYAEINEKTLQLNAVSEARTRFWSNISHELRSPINSVVGLARLLAAPGSDPLTDEQRKQVGLIDASGTTLLALVNELLDVAKAEAGRLVPHIAPVDLPTVLLQLRETLRSTITSSAVKLVIDEPATLPAVWTDETMLIRILRNLLSNSLKFTERGEVRLTVRPDDDQLARFVVSDTGIGIPPDQTETVFEEFHQVRTQRHAHVQGTGLGLPYARKLARLLGGELTLVSDLGSGTTVTLRLPFRDPVSTPLPAIGAVLVVDDDAGFRDLITVLLGEFTGRVDHAEDGRAALEALAESRPDLVVLDLHMPGMNGREVLTVLREKPNLYDIPVVVVTSAAPEGLDVSSTGLGAALLLKSNLSTDTVKLAITEAFAVRPRTVRG